jgi:hypothetical protein
MTDHQLPSYIFESLPTSDIRRVLGVRDSEPLLFCHKHGIWSPGPCPGCQTPWPESPQGLPCGDCVRCFHGNSCKHACEAPICHPEQDCLPEAGKGHHV